MQTVSREPIEEKVTKRNREHWFPATERMGNYSSESEEVKQMVKQKKIKKLLEKETIWLSLHDFAVSSSTDAHGLL